MWFEEMCDNAKDFLDSGPGKVVTGIAIVAASPLLVMGAIEVAAAAGAVAAVAGVTDATVLAVAGAGITATETAALAAGTSKIREGLQGGN